jgi:UDP-N-acetylglucosamine--N-acetylmuramyl-(pentapeptide) pyrophosphoryl-undecaprenol N-acetylglucosamine transferase
VEARYVGDPSGIEASLATRAGLPFSGVATASFYGASPWSLPGRAIRLSRGTAQCSGIIGEFQPQALLATGGYVSGPAILAAWLKRVPSLVYLPDLIPGLAIRYLGRFATRVAVSFERSIDSVPGKKAAVTGYPVRPELFGTNKAGSRRRLKLDEDTSTLLVLGGSQGAHSINLATSRILEELLQICQIVHIGGERDIPWLLEKKEELPAALSRRYRVYEYLHDEMIAALGAADLAIARAGAATIGEFPAVGLPSVLIPYPYAGKHQYTNAQYMVENQAAVKVEDANLEAGVLLETVAALLNDKKRLVELGDRARSLARPDAAARIASLLVDISLKDSRTRTTNYEIAV